LCVVELLAAAIEQLLLGFETGQAVGGFLGTESFFLRAVGFLLSDKLLDARP